MIKKRFMCINELDEEPYSTILGFPRSTKRTTKSRIAELQKLGITKVAFWGPTRIGSLDILGKGYVGIVILGRMQNKTVAIKIRRNDSQRSDLRAEAKLLQIVNKVQVGPRFIAASKNFLIMEYLDGQKIVDWVQDKRSVGEIKRTLRKILEDCNRLDDAGIDHGELSTISKHIIVGKKTTMIDFESASTKRRVSNVTSATQGLYIGSGIAKKISQTYKTPTKMRIIQALRKYKRNMTCENFDDLLRVLKL